MEKQRIFFARNRKHANQQKDNIMNKEWKLDHNVKSLSMQEPTVWILVLETCRRQTLTIQEDLSFKII